MIQKHLESRSLNSFARIRSLLFHRCGARQNKAEEQMVVSDLDHVVLVELIVVFLLFYHCRLLCMYLSHTDQSTFLSITLSHSGDSR